MKSTVKVKPPKKRLSMMQDLPYVVEFEKNYAGIQMFSYGGSVSICCYADYKTNKFSKSELADLKAFHKSIGDVLAFVEKQV